VHVAIFIGLAVGLYHQDPGGHYPSLLALLLGGFACNGALSYFFLLRRPGFARSGGTPVSFKAKLRRRLLGAFEAMMNRDFAYLLVLLAVILRSRSAVNRWARASWEWIPLGLLSGVGPILLAAVVRMLVSGDPSPIGGALPLSTVGLVFMFLYQMGNSAIIEEPAFRGFLWGHLEQRGWSGVRIWFFQAALFWLAHVRYIDRPFTLWVTVPVGGLLFG